MTRTKKETHVWTKEEIKSVNELWKTATTVEICERLKVNYQQLSYMVSEMRKAGIQLPKKNLQGLVREVMGELK